MLTTLVIHQIGQITCFGTLMDKNVFFLWIFVCLSHLETNTTYWFLVTFYYLVSSPKACSMPSAGKGNEFDCQPILDHLFSIPCWWNLQFLVKKTIQVRERIQNLRPHALDTVAKNGTLPHTPIRHSNQIFGRSCYGVDVFPCCSSVGYGVDGTCCGS